MKGNRSICETKRQRPKNKGEEKWFIAEGAGPGVTSSGDEAADKGWSTQ